MLIDKAFEIINKYTTEINRIPYNPDIEEEMDALFENAGVQFDSTQFDFDSPGYSRYDHAYAFIDEEGKLRMIEWSEECY